MNTDVVLLKEAYHLFVHRYPDFSYDINDVMLYSVHEDEYSAVYKMAADQLNIPITATPIQLEAYSSKLRAELLKTPKKAIIIMNASIKADRNELIMMIVHELAHAYYDSIVTLEFPEGGKERFLFEIGKRMWMEYVAEHLTWMALHYDSSSLINRIERDFKSLLSDSALYPERLGFLLFKFRLLGLSSDGIATIAKLEKKESCPNKLLLTIENIQRLLSEGTESDINLLKSSKDMVRLGGELFSFVYYYFQYFEYTDTFLEKTE